MEFLPRLSLRMGEVKVIGGEFPSIPCFRVEWALKLKGVEYQFIAEDVVNKSQMLLNYNPLQEKVPLLLHNGNPVIESLVILEYIEEIWKDNPLLPQDPFERAMARYWAGSVDEKCMLAVWGAMCTEGEGKQRAVDSAAETLNGLDRMLGGRKFFGGESIGYLDIVVGWISHWLPAMEKVGGMKLIDAERLPRLNAWATNFSHAPIIKDNLPPLDMLLDYFLASREYMLP